MWLDGCPGIEHGEAVIMLVDDRVGMISARGFHDGGSWLSLIYSGICFASNKNFGKPPSQ
jgi:hypothetical protein